MTKKWMLSPARARCCWIAFFSWNENDTETELNVYCTQSTWKTNIAASRPSVSCRNCMERNSNEIRCYDVWQCMVRARITTLESHTPYFVCTWKTISRALCTRWRNHNNLHRALASQPASQPVSMSRAILNKRMNNEERKKATRKIIRCFAAANNNNNNSSSSSTVHNTTPARPPYTNTQRIASALLLWRTDNII